MLIYRSSRDGWEYINFHAHCDNKGPTVTVVKSGNYIFGGYTEQSWNGKHSVIIKKNILVSLSLDPAEKNMFVSYVLSPKDGFCCIRSCTQIVLFLTYRSLVHKGRIRT